jgi:dTDP-4-dehydrorhamnose 3,5-epimerase
MKVRLSVEPTPLIGLSVVQRHPIGDSRGFFERLFCDEELGTWLRGRPLRQVSRSRTSAVGAVRGLHFQHAPSAEAKVVLCLQGRVFDVAVDIRRNSPTFLQWHGEELSAENHRGLLIPEGFAHGFQTLENDCELLYLITAPHTPSAEGGLHVNDPHLGIRWPLPVSGLSARDAAFPLVTSSFLGFDE